jgi:lysophospholipase L1-like esterase
MFRCLAPLGLLLAAPAAAQAPLPVHIGGRAVAEPEGAWRFGWPGVYFEGRFSGTGVAVAVDSATEHFRVLIDGVERAVLSAPGTARLAIGGLAPGPHVVRLEKQTESQEGSARFLGFRPLDGAMPLPPSPRARRIEFVGDSWSAGYGNASPGRVCTSERRHQLTDTQRAFGPLVAARLDADYRIIAYSGFGMVRNYGGAAPELSLPAIYDRAIPGEPARAAADDAAWRPQLIVIALGTNDFSTALRPGERWADQAALRADWRARYVAFVRLLMARQPQARFLLLGDESFFPEVEQVAAALNRDAARPVATLRHGGLALTGCDFHPGLADHRALAELVAGAIGRIDELWD